MITVTMIVLTCFVLTYCICTSESTSNQLDLLNKTACDGDMLTLQCDQKYTLNIVWAGYGRAVPGHIQCPHPTGGNTVCVMSDVTDTVRQLCQDQDSCTFKATITGQNYGGVFPTDPCPNHRKYTDVNYTCIPDCWSNQPAGICPVCQEGLVQDPVEWHACNDIDECQSSKKICQYDGVDHQCVNSIGSYSCVCQDGYENVSPVFCDKPIKPPKRPDWNLPGIPGVIGPVSVLSTYIVLFGLYVIIMDIRLIMAVLYRWCTTEPLSESESDLSEGDEEPEVVCGARKAYWEPQILTKGRKCNNLFSARGEVIWTGEKDTQASSERYSDTSDIRSDAPRSGRPFSSFSSSTTVKPSSLYAPSTVTDSSISPHSLRLPRSKKLRKTLRTAPSSSAQRPSFTSSTSHRHKSFASHGSGRRSSLASSKNEHHKSPDPPKSSSTEYRSVASSGRVRSDSALSDAGST